MDWDLVIITYLVAPFSVSGPTLNALSRLACRSFDCELMMAKRLLVGDSICLSFNFLLLLCWERTFPARLLLDSPVRAPGRICAEIHVWILALYKLLPTPAVWPLAWVGRSVVSVCLSVCPRFESKTHWAINTKLYASRSCGRVLLLPAWVCMLIRLPMFSSLFAYLTFFLTFFLPYSFLPYAFFLNFLLFGLLPDLSIYTFQNRPVPFPGRRL